MFLLEPWIHQIAGNVLSRNTSTRSDVEEYQFILLQQTLRYAYERSSFYRESFSKAGITPDDVQRLRDLSKLPFTEPRHLCESPYRLLCVSQAAIARPHSFVTSGTTGPQKKVFWTMADLERIIEFMAAGIGTVAGADDVVQILLADGRPYSQADLLYRAVKRIGAAPVISGMNAEAEEQLRMLEDSSSTVLFGYTGQIFRLSKELQNIADLASKGIKVLFLAGEYLPEAMRLELKRLWKCRVHTHYGLTEMGLGVAVECEAHAGYHFNEAALIMEVIDPRTGQVLPPGEEGELVFTTLTREAMPLIRYRTHDISRIIPDPCPCGSTSLLRIDSVRKRLESIVTMEGGDEIYPSLLDDVLYEVPGLIDYQATLARKEGKYRLDLKAAVITPGSNNLQEVRRRLLSIPVVARKIANGTMLEPTIGIADRDSLQPVDRAKKLIRENS